MSKETKVVSVIVTGEKYCQDCKFHKNNPSRCPFYGFVPRKDTGCKDFRKE